MRSLETIVATRRNGRVLAVPLSGHTYLFVRVVALRTVTHWVKRIIFVVKAFRVACR
jgi:hypothetical protein